MPPKKSIQDIDTETIFTGIDLNGFSNSKLIIDMETEDLIINKNEIIYKTIDPQFSMNQIVSTQKSVVSETEEQIITNAEEISKQQTEELSISKKEMELSNNITIDVQSSINQIPSTQNNVTTKEQVRKKVMDVVLRNLKNVLDKSNNNSYNQKHKQTLILIKKIQQFGKDKQLNEINQNSNKILISSEFANLIDLTESDILSPSRNKKSKKE